MKRKINVLVTFLFVALVSGCSEHSENRAEQSEHDSYEYNDDAYADEGAFETSESEIEDFFCQFVSPDHRFAHECVVDAEGLPMNSNGTGSHILTLQITDNPGLKNVGIDNFTVVMDISKGYPKFQAKSYNVMVADFSVRSDEKPEAVFPVDVNVMITPEQAQSIKRLGAPPSDMPLYQIEDVSLNITKVEDVPLFDEQKELIQFMEIDIAGRQIIEGELSVTLSKLNPSAPELPILTASFREDSFWYYNPDL